MAALGTVEVLDFTGVLAPFEVSGWAFAGSAIHWGTVTVVGTTGVLAPFAVTDYSLAGTLPPATAARFTLALGDTAMAGLAIGADDD
jgi:hypothetical protein